MVLSTRPQPPVQACLEFLEGLFTSSNKQHDIGERNATFKLFQLARWIPRKKLLKQQIPSPVKLAGDSLGMW